jgi:hypothetical protein
MILIVMMSESQGVTGAELSQKRTNNVSLSSREKNKTLRSFDGLMISKPPNDW